MNVPTSHYYWSTTGAPGAGYYVDLDQQESRTRRFCKLMVFQFLAGIPLSLLLGPGILLLVYFPFFFICPATFGIFLPVLAGSVFYSFAGAIASQQRPVNEELSSILEETKSIEIDDFSEIGFYEEATSSELVDVYHVINKKKYRARFLALILEMRQRSKPGYRNL